ncbi:MAG: hypothetical protein HQM16_16445 [Deltaproteobacteria bacterium]|nr:hypothetical protein [Deltaproteobacteria bacterium]
MKKRKLFMPFMATLLVIFCASCGDIKVKGDIDDHDVDAVADALEDENNNSTNGDTNSDMQYDQGSIDPEQSDDTDQAVSSYEDAADSIQSDDVNQSTTGISVDTTVSVTTNITNTTQAPSTDTADNIEGSDASESNEFEMSCANRTFVGTYDKRYTNCGNWPSTIRIYKCNGIVDIERTTGTIIAQGEIFLDNSIDFVTYYNDQFNEPTQELVCNCYLYDETAWYSYDFECNCDFADGLTCFINYDKKN